MKKTLQGLPHCFTPFMSQEQRKIIKNTKTQINKLANPPCLSLFRSQLRDKEHIFKDACNICEKTADIKLTIKFKVI